MKIQKHKSIRFSALFASLVFIVACSKKSQTPQNGGGNGGGTITPTLSVNLDSLKPSYSINTMTVSVTSNVAWTVTDNQSWISTSVSNGTGNASFSVDIQENTLSSTRSGVITIATNNITKLIYVVQASGPSAINKFIPANSVYFYYGNGTEPYRMAATNPSGNDVLVLDSANVNALKIEFHNVNLNNVTTVQSGSTNYMTPGNVTNVSSSAEFAAVTDTAGKAYVRIMRADGSNMTLTGVTNPVKNIYMPLVGAGTGVANKSFVTKQAPFTANNMPGIFTNPTHANNPVVQTYKLIQ